MSNKKHYSKYNNEPTSEAESSKPRRRSFRKWIKDYILKDEMNDPAREPISETAGTTNGFNKQFEGWNLRLHRANGGHIIEAWKNDDNLHVISSNSRRSHELFMVMDSEDMGARLNDILVQLMLRG
jgi:hypothetical protein